MPPNKNLHRRLQSGCHGGKNLYCLCQRTSSKADCGKLSKHACSGAEVDDGKGLVLFGDPFNGAPVKGVAKDKIREFCNASDAVCDGKLSITAGHMAYAGSE